MVRTVIQGEEPIENGSILIRFYEFYVTNSYLSKFRETQSSLERDVVLKSTQI